MRDHVKLAETVSASSPSSEPNVPVPGDGAPQSKRHPYQCLLRVSRALLLLTYAGGVALGSWIVYALTRQSATEMRDYAFAVAGIFVGLAVPLSLHDMNMHVRQKAAQSRLCLPFRSLPATPPHSFPHLVRWRTMFPRCRPTFYGSYGSCQSTRCSRGSPSYTKLTHSFSSLRASATRLMQFFHFISSCLERSAERHASQRN